MVIPQSDGLPVSVGQTLKNRDVFSELQGRIHACLNKRHRQTQSGVVITLPCDIERIPSHEPFLGFNAAPFLGFNAVPFLGFNVVPFLGFNVDQNE